MSIEIFQFCFHKFSCAGPTVISSIFGKNFHFPFPYFVLFVLRHFPFHMVHICRDRERERERERERYIDIRLKKNLSICIALNHLWKHMCGSATSVLTINQKQLKVQEMAS